LVTVLAGLISAIDGTPVAAQTAGIRPGRTWGRKPSRLPGYWHYADHPMLWPFGIGPSVIADAGQHPRRSSWHAVPSWMAGPWGLAWSDHSPAMTNGLAPNGHRVGPYRAIPPARATDTIGPRVRLIVAIRDLAAW